MISSRWYILLYYAFMEFVLLFSLLIYTSDFPSVPWYEEDGLKYLHFVITTPIPLFFAFVLNCTIDRSAMGKLKYLLYSFPVICFICTTVYIAYDGGSIGSDKIAIGRTICFALFVVSIVFIVIDLRKRSKQR